MNWKSWSDFISMGGYATYVWSSFFLFFVTLAVELWTLKKEERALFHVLMLSKRISQPPLQNELLTSEEVDS